MSDSPARIAEYELECRRGAAELRSMGKSAGWKLIDDVSGTKIYLRAETFGSNSNSVFKGEGVVACPPHIAVELLMDSQKKPQYDSIFEGATVLEEITDHIKFEHMVYWAPWPVQRRDFVMLLNKARLEDGTVVLFGKSACHSSTPEKPKHVRAEILIGGWLLIPCDAEGQTVKLDDATHTHLTFVACTDLRGSIPAVIKGQLDRKQPALINAVKPLLAKRVAELAAMKDRAEADKVHQRLKAVMQELPVYSEKELADAKGATAN